MYNLTSLDALKDNDKYIGYLLNIKKNENTVLEPLEQYSDKIIIELIDFLFNNSPVVN